jgi:hypothetical protein
MRISELKQLIYETMDEMARTAGSGATYQISEKGKNIIRQLKNGQIPELNFKLGKNHLAVLKVAAQNSDVWMSKREIAAIVCESKISSGALAASECQPYVNKEVGHFAEEGILNVRGYEKTGGGDGSSRSSTDFGSMFADIDI